MIDLDMMKLLGMYAPQLQQSQQPQQTPQVPQGNGEYTPLTRDRLASALGYTPLTRESLGRTLNGGGALANLFASVNPQQPQINNDRINALEKALLRAGAGGKLQTAILNKAREAEAQRAALYYGNGGQWQ